MQGYIRGAREHKRRRDNKLEERLTRAREVAEAGAKLLREKYGATQVMLFGSLTGISVFHSRSDVDLAVWGIPEGDYYRAVADLLILDADIQVDLVAFEFARTALQEFIQSQGVVL